MADFVDNEAEESDLSSDEGLSDNEIRPKKVDPKKKKQRPRIEDDDDDEEEEEGKMAVPVVYL